ncbi:MAG: TolC family protein [Candidatus Brocadia sp. BROELEC01]|nr:TolC family protein [Candidatus Brocadia sapporoensis]QQR66237.1 MAG: TolC family protein [Candidatus Brocadia sp.]RZV57388.1 MAG: TolC family protein [Candidatus Brocadia sp. BROELEC01]
MENIMKRRSLFYNNTHLSIAIIFLLLFFGSKIVSGEEIGIKEALDLFYKNNYDIAKNKYEIDKASADLLEAKLRLNPTLTINGSGFAFASGYGIINDQLPSQLSVRLDQPVRLGNKKELAIASAKENLEATKLSYKDFIRNILVVFYTVYYNLSLDRITIDFSRDELARFEKIIKVAEIKYNKGFLSFNDYTKLKLTRIDLENALIISETKYKNDLEDFNLLLGSKNHLEPAKMPFPEKFQDYTEGCLLEKAYANRPDFLSIQRQIKASGYNVSLAKAKRIPDISVGVEYDAFGTAWDPGAGGGISVGLPLFNRNQAEISRRIAERNQIEIQAEKTNNQIITDIRQSLSNYRGSLKIFESYKRKKTEIEKFLEDSEKAFSLGGVTVLDLIDTRRTYKDFMTKHNQSLTQTMLNTELLKVYTGETK